MEDTSEPKGAAVPGLRSEEPATSDEGRRRAQAPGGEREDRAVAWPVVAAHELLRDWLLTVRTDTVRMPTTMMRNGRW